MNHDFLAIKITDHSHHNKLIMEKFEILKIIKYDIKRGVSKPVEKMVPIDLLNAGLPKTFNLLEKNNNNNNICKVR